MFKFGGRKTQPRNDVPVTTSSSANEEAGQQNKLPTLKAQEVDPLLHPKGLDASEHGAPPVSALQQPRPAQTFQPQFRPVQHPAKPPIGIREDMRVQTTTLLNNEAIAEARQVDGQQKSSSAGPQMAAFTPTMPRPSTGTTNGSLNNQLNSPEKTSTGLLIRPGPVIETFAELLESGLDFKLTKDASEGEKKFDVASHLRGKVVPVFKSGIRNVCWIFCLQRMARTEMTAEIAAEMRKQGLSLAQEFQLVQFGDVLLQQIDEGKITSKKLKLKRDIDSHPESSRLQVMFTDIIAWAYKNGAADVDFRYSRRTDRSQVGFNIDGKWVYPERFIIDSDMMMRCLSLAFQMGEGASENGLEQFQEQQLRIYLTLPDGAGDVMLRWAAMAADNVYSVTTRIIRLSQGVQLTLDQLGYMPDHRKAITRAIRSDGGAVIFSGVVNSGKSTSLAAMVSEIPPTRKIITIEDPAEAMIPGAIINTVSRPLDGGESGQLKAKLATLKRTGYQDLLLGEIRDRETGKAAQDVFESGQKLYTTVHGAAAWKIPDRLAGPQIGIPREALASPGNLRLLVYQALLPTNCQHCALPLNSLLSTHDSAEREYWDAYIKRLSRLYRADLSRVTIRNPEGCEKCRREGLTALYGLKGRTTAAEMIEPDDEFCALVDKHDGIGMIKYLKRLRGTSAFDDPAMIGKSAMECAIYKVLTGSIDPREVEPRFSTFEQIEIMMQRQG